MKPYLKNPVVTSVSFAQDSNTCDPEVAGVQEITISTEYVPTGNDEPDTFWTVSTKRWAFDSLDELIRLLKRAGVK